jgi:t-SNARE complex subunit (syntaxin)
MNDKRRREIRKIKEQIADLAMRLEDIRDQEQESFDNMPESLQQGERGEKMESAINELEEVINDIQYADDKLETAAE